MANFGPSTQPSVSCLKKTHCQRLPLYRMKQLLILCKTLERALDVQSLGGEQSSVSPNCVASLAAADIRNVLRVFLGLYRYNVWLALRSLASTAFSRSFESALVAKATA